MSAPPTSDPRSEDVKPARSVLVTDRDRAAIRWCGEMYAARRDMLSWVLVAPGADSLSLGRVGTITRRWETLGFAEAARLEHSQPDWLWLTDAGMTFAGLDDEAGPPPLVNLAHTYAVGQVRARAEHAGWCTGWTSERSLLADKPDSRAHTPDGVLIASDGPRWALELERTQKSGRRLDRIIGELITRAAACDAVAVPEFPPLWWWNRILYVTTTPGAAGAVRRAVDRLPNHLRHLIAVRDLTEFTP